MREDMIGRERQVLPTGRLETGLEGMSSIRRLASAHPDLRRSSEGLRQDWE